MPTFAKEYGIGSPGRDQIQNTTSTDCIVHSHHPTLKM
jgi:hypothetical protein